MPHGLLGEPSGLANHRAELLKFGRPKGKGKQFRYPFHPCRLRESKRIQFIKKAGPLLVLELAAPLDMESGRAQSDDLASQTVRQADRVAFKIGQA